MRAPHRLPATLATMATLTILLTAYPTQTANASVWPTNGWTTATPNAMGMNAAPLAQARDYAVSHGGGAGFITRGGKLVLSWGFADQVFDVKSTTKSIGATILGLAIKDGLANLSDPAIDHYAGFGLPPAENGGTGWLDEISIEQLATHAAGFEKGGGFINTVWEPSTKWAYSDGGANWLADVLTIAYGQDLHTVLFDRVLEPMGLTSADLMWHLHGSRGTTIEGITRREFGSGIFANVDALARIGYLYLRNGQWEGVPLIPQTFVDAARRPVPSITSLPVADPIRYPGASRHYGLLWWNNADGTLPGVPTDAYWSWGLGEVLIVVIPSLDIVVSRAGSTWQPDWSTNYSVLEPFLNPIVQSVFAPVHVPTSSAPAKVRLGPVAPTPFRHSTGIRYSVSQAGPVSLAIFDVSGRRVRRWSWADHAAGDAILRWDGHGESGNRVPAGVHFLRLTANGETQTAKTIILD